jgi:hypothetical protein
MPATTQTLANILQLNYQPGIVRQFNDDYPNLRYIRQNSRSITTEGDEAVFNIETGLNEGGGFHGETADVPVSGAPTHKIHRLRLKQMTFRMTISMKLMRKARTNAASFARGYQKMMETTRDAVTLTANQYLWGDGSGVMARVQANNLGASDSLVLNRAYGLANGGSPESLIRPGQLLHILDTKGFESGVSADRGVGIVDTVDWDTGTPGQIRVTFRAGYTFAAVAADDYVYLQNTIEGWVDPDEVEDNAPAMGLLGFYDNTARPVLQTLDSAVEPMWKAQDVATTQAAVIANLRTARNRVSKRMRQGRTNYLISSYETHERYSAELDEKIEFRNVNRYDSGWDFTDFYGRPWFMDHTAPDTYVFFVPSGNIIERHAVTNFIEFVDEGTGPMYQVPGKTVFDQMLTAIYNYGIRRRNVLVRATGLTWAPGS